MRICARCRGARGINKGVMLEHAISQLYTHAGGVDFEDEGSGLGERRVRISFPGSTEHVAEAMRRLQRWWQSEQGRRWHS